MKKFVIYRTDGDGEGWMEMVEAKNLAVLLDVEFDFQSECAKRKDIADDFMRWIGEMGEGTVSIFDVTANENIINV